uniref:Uncharacterized protein n=1 Tax=Ciona intestinalis TaxID=7719 RepID=F6V409_CIOIN
MQYNVSMNTQFCGCQFPSLYTYIYSYYYKCYIGQATVPS